MSPPPPPPSVATLSTTAVATLSAADELVQENLFTVDDLIRSRAKHYPDIPILSYPSSDSALTEYSHYSVGDLNRFADEAARAYLRAGIDQVVRIARSSEL